MEQEGRQPVHIFLPRAAPTQTCFYYLFIYSLQLRRDRDAVEQTRQLALSRRRQMLLQRRADNVDKRQQLADLQRFQGGFTRPWVFSYGVTWPRETYAKYRRT